MKKCAMQSTPQAKVRNLLRKWNEKFWPAKERFPVGAIISSDERRPLLSRLYRSPNHFFRNHWMLPTSLDRSYSFEEVMEKRRKGGFFVYFVQKPKDRSVIVRFRPIRAKLSNAANKCWAALPGFITKGLRFAFFRAFECAMCSHMWITLCPFLSFLASLVTQLLPVYFLRGYSEISFPICSTLLFSPMVVEFLTPNPFL